MPARWGWCRAKAWPRASSTDSAPRCWTAPSAPRPAAMRWPPPTAARSACTWSTLPRAVSSSSGAATRSRRTCTSGLSRRQAKRAGARLICIDPRKTETADKCHQHIALLPGTDGALALGLMHELIVNDWLDHDYIERHTEGWPALRERALQWPPERAAAGVRHHGRRSAWPGPRLRHHHARGDPAELRHAAGARWRQCGAAGGDPALSHRRVAPPRRRPAAVRLGLVQALSRRCGDAAPRPARDRVRSGCPRAPAAHHQHEHHRRRPAARQLARLRAEDRSPGRLQQQSRGGGARVAQGGEGLRAATTCSPWCSSTS